MTKRRLIGRLGAALVLVGAAGLGLAGGATAEEHPGGETYTLTARADTFAFEFVETAAPAAPGGEIFYATPSTAQALLDSVGRSEGFAAAPSPGPFFATLPSNGNGVLAGFGFPFSFPDYPFYAASSHPVAPSADKAFGPFRARAESDEFEAVGDARSGGLTNDDPAFMSSRASASVSVNPVDKTRTAVANSRFDGFTTGPLALGQSLASAKMTQRPGSEPTKESSFTLGSFTIAGVQVAMTDEGFKLGDQAPPTADMSQLFGVLAQAGITVEFLPATETPTSIDSAGLRITRAGTDPSGTQHKVSLILGRVGTSVVGGSTPAALDEPTVVAEPDPTPADATFPGEAPPDSPEVFEPSLGTLPVFDNAPGSLSSIVGSSPTPDAASDAAAPAAPLVTQTQAQLAAPASVAVPGPDATAFYVALAAAGLLMTAGTRVLSVLGVKLGLRGGVGGSAADVPVSVLRLPNK